jgi:N-acetylneuraminic acid mutarotase
MIHRLILLVILLFCLSTFNGCKFSQVSTKVEKLANGSWSEVQSSDGSLPVERHEAAFVGVKDKMYLLGGRGMRPVSIYDVAKNIWTQGAVVPIELHHFQPVIYKNEIYICGAMTGKYPGETPVPDIYIYNPANDTWRKGPTIPESRHRGGAGATIHNDKLYLICGIKDGHRGDHKKWTDVYDFSAKSWSTLPDAPRARDHFQSVYADGKIYNVGGRTTISSDNPFKNTIGEIDVYDVSQKSWTTLAAPLPTLRAGNFAIVLAKEILVIGGESYEQELAHNEVEALNTVAQSWRTLPRLPKGRHGTGVVFYNGNLYTASGSGNHGGGPEMSDLWKYSWPSN